MIKRFFLIFSFIIGVNAFAFCRGIDCICCSHSQIGTSLSQCDTTDLLNQIVVTGTRSQRALKDVPVVTRVITSAQIKKESPRSLADLLETEIPGLEFTRTEGVTNSITFQGLGANYLLILVDGERLSGETQRSNPDFNRIDINNVERIEIVKGAMSTLYGSGAVAGVINIITKGNRKPFEAQIEAMYSGEGEEKSGVNIGVRGEIGDRSEITSYTTLAANFKQRYFYKDVEIEGFRNFSVGERIGYSYSDKFKASLKGSYYNHERFNAGDVGKKKHDLYEDYNFILRGDYNINPDNKLYFSYNFDTYNKYAKYLLLDSKELNYKDVINNPRIVFTTSAIKNNTITSGVECFSESLKTYQFAESDNSEYKTRSAVQFAMFVQDEYNLTERFSFQFGLRGDYHDAFKGVTVTPKLSAMYKIGDAKSYLWILRAGYSSGYRTPTLKELYTSWDHQGLFILKGNEDLKPEKSNNYQISTEYSSKSVNISVTGFYNYIYDKISTVWNSAQDTSFYANIDHARIFGGDLNARWQISKSVALKAGYAYVNDRAMVNGFNTSSTRPHSATFRVEYNFEAFRRDFTVGLNGRWLSAVDTWSEQSNLAFAKTHYEGYTIWKLGAVANLKRGIRVNLGINNLFNYKPEQVSFNAGITRGITLFGAISIAIDELFSLK